MSKISVRWVQFRSYQSIDCNSCCCTFCKQALTTFCFQFHVQKPT